MTDTDTRFSKDIGWTKGDRTGRYAMIIDHGKITYAENEPGGDVTVRYSFFALPNMLNILKVSGADAVLKAL